MYTEELINTDCLHIFLSIGLIYQKIHLKPYIFRLIRVYNIVNSIESENILCFYQRATTKKNLFLLKLTTVFVEH